jgi:hypothetical protein
MYANQSSEDGVILYLDMSCQGCGISHDYMVFNDAIMGDMGIGHNKIVVSNGRYPATFLGAPVDGEIFSKDVVISNDQAGFSSPVFQILRNIANGRERENSTSFADLCGAFDYDMRVY